MSTQSQFTGGTRATTSIKNAFAVEGYTRQTVEPDPAAVATLSGSMAVGVLKTVLNETSPCRMSYFTVRTVDTSFRTIRVQVTVDGTVVYNFNSADNDTINTGLCLAGKFRATGNYNILPDIVAVASLKIEIASSVTETDKLIIEWIYNRES